MLSKTAIPTGKSTDGYVSLRTPLRAHFYTVLQRYVTTHAWASYAVVDNRMMPRLGQLDTPLYGTSAGRALLALDTDEDVKALFPVEGAKKQKTAISRTLLDQLDDIRRTGISSDYGELIE